MSNKHNEVSRNKAPREDGEFYMALGWLSALSVSISSMLSLN